MMKGIPEEIEEETGAAAAADGTVREGGADGSRSSASSLCVPMNVVAASFKRDSRLLIIFHHALSLFPSAVSSVSLCQALCVYVCGGESIEQIKKRGGCCRVLFAPSMSSPRHPPSIQHLLSVLYGCCCCCCCCTRFNLRQKNL